MKKLIPVVLGAFLLVSYYGCAQRGIVNLIRVINEAGGLEKYPNANALALFDSTSVDLQKNGQFVWRQHKLVKILTEVGKRRYSDATFTYYTKYDTVEVLLARVIGKDGKVTKISKKSIKDLPIPAFGKFFLPNVRMKKITFPNLEIGSSIEWEMKDIMRSPPMENNYDAMEIFQGSDPILVKTYTISAPSDMKLRWVTRNGEIQFTKTKAAGKTNYTWQVRDMPQIISEPSMPPITDVATKLLVSTVKSWKTWSHWYYELCKDKFATDAAINEKIAELTKDAKTRDDTIRALYYFVSQNIRYVATTMSGKKGGYEPFPATKTFKDKYGVCRDKACLLTAMLRHVGMDAYTVLTNPMIHVDSAIPVDQFNHAITAIRNPDGSFTYVDGTAENTMDLLLPIEQDKGVLVCDERGEDLAYTPLVPPQDNTLTITANGKLLEDGTLTEKVNWQGNGIMDYSFRSFIKSMPLDRVKMIFQSIIQSISPGAVLDTFYTTDANDLYHPLVINFSYTAKNFGLKTGNIYQFSMPFTASRSFGMTFGGGNPFALPKRNYPVYMWSTMGSKVNETISIPKGYKVKALPSGFQEDIKFFTSSSKYSKSRDQIKRISEAYFYKPLITVSEYPTLKEVMDKLSKLSKEQVILEAK